MALTKKQQDELIAEARKQGVNMVKWLDERGFVIHRSHTKGHEEYYLTEKKK